jgi:hypothetical protein
MNTVKKSYTSNIKTHPIYPYLSYYMTFVYAELMYEHRMHQGAHISLSYIGINDKNKSLFTPFTPSGMKMELSWRNTMSAVNSAINSDVHNDKYSKLLD